jgi:hypothetical protein
MSYAKLYATILDSSIWSASDTTRLVWITMLAMATKNGLVHASVDGLARRANVPIEKVREALRELSSPDKNDKSGVRDGRRILPMQGCWQLVNFEFYRETRSIDAVRKQQWRERQASSRKLDVQDVLERPTSSRSAPAPETAPAPAPEVKKGSARRAPSPEPAPEDITTPEIITIRRKSNVAPDDFEPNDTHRFRCQELRFDIDELLAAFKRHEFNRDYSDWPRRFGKWIEDEKLTRERDAAKSGPRASSRAHSPDDRLRKQADRIQMLREQEAEEERRAKGAQ